MLADGWQLLLLLLDVLHDEDELFEGDAAVVIRIKLRNEFANYKNYLSRALTFCLVPAGGLGSHVHVVAANDTLLLDVNSLEHLRVNVVRRQLLNGLLHHAVHSRAGAALHGVSRTVLAILLVGERRLLVIP